MFRTIIQTISPERFATYLKSAGWDEERALQLYIWNAHVGEAFHTPIQAVEIGLRNRINNALVTCYASDWWRNGEFKKTIDRERHADLDIVKKRIENRGLLLETGQIVAGLSFGFWVGMLQPRYNPAIWGGHLRSCFPRLPSTESRDSLWKSARAVASLRNRISHHEPIFNQDLLRDFSEAMKLLGWICPETEHWIRPHCRVNDLLRRKP